MIKDHILCKCPSMVQALAWAIFRWKAAGKQLEDRFHPACSRCLPSSGTAQAIRCILLMVLPRNQWHCHRQSILNFDRWQPCSMQYQARLVAPLAHEHVGSVRLTPAVVRLQITFTLFLFWQVHSRPPERRSGRSGRRWMHWTRR